MKSISKALILVSGLLPLVSPVHATPVGAAVTVDGQTWFIPASNSENPDHWNISNKTLETPGFHMNFNFAADEDPYLGWAISVVDFDAPSTFAFSFFIPIVPTGPATTVSASIAGELTDSSFDGVSIDPAGANTTVMQVYLTAPLTSMGVDLGGAVASGPTLVTVPYGTFSSGDIAGPNGIWTGLQVDVSFVLSGGRDVASLNGIARVDTDLGSEVPDGGATVALFGLSIAGLAFARGKKAA